MINKFYKFSACVDGEEFVEIELEFNDYRTKETRKNIREGIAATYQIPAKYVKLLVKE